MDLKRLETRLIVKYLILFLAMLMLAVKFGAALSRGSNFFIRGFISLPLVLIAPSIVKKYGLFPILFITVLSFWIPLAVGLKQYFPFFGSMYPLEIGAWSLFFYILISMNDSKHARRRQNLKNYPLLLFFLFGIGALITHFISNGNPQDLNKVRLIFFTPAVLFFICLYIIETEKQAELLIWAFLISALMLGMLTLFGERQFHIGSEWESHVRLSYYFNFPLLGRLYMHPAAIGDFFSILITLSFNFFLNHPSRRKRLFSFILLAVFSVVLLRSQTRAGLIAVCFSFLIIWILSKYIKKKRMALSFMLAAISLVSILGLFWYRAVNSLNSGNTQRAIELFSNPFEAVNFVSRINQWQFALSVITKTFWGVGMFGFTIISDGNAAGVHNMFLYYYLSAGFLGFFSFILLQTRFFKMYWLNLRSAESELSRVICIGGIGVLLVWWISGITDPMMTTFWGIGIIWIPTAIAAAVVKSLKIRAQ